MDQYRADLIAHLSGFVTENRLSLFHQVLDRRTRYLTVLLEDIFQSQNASAVLRTCDCLGIQDVHIVEQRNVYEINPDVALGSHQWLTLNYYNKGGSNIRNAIEVLKNKNYRIVATSPHAGGSTPEAFDIGKGKAALMFGTELNGLTPEALEMADEYIRIPMFGFTESYNISVTAAIVLYQLRNRLVASSLDWTIGDKERADLMLEWLRTSIKMSEQIEAQFRKEYRSTF